MADTSDIIRQLSFYQAGGKPEGQHTTDKLDKITGTLNDVIAKRLAYHKAMLEGQKTQVDMGKTAAETDKLNIENTPYWKAEGLPSPEDVAGQQSAAEKNMALYQEGRQKFLASGQQGRVAEPPAPAIDPYAEARKHGYDPRMTLGQNSTMALSGLRQAQTYKAMNPTVPFGEQSVPVTPELSTLTGGIMNPGETRKGFEVLEAFKQKRLNDQLRMRQELTSFSHQMAQRPPGSLISDVATIQSSVKALDEIESLVRDADSKGLMPVGRLQGYMTEGAQKLGLLSDEEATIRTSIKNQNAITLRNLGGTALTKTEKETFEEALPLLTVSPTEFYARLRVIRNSLLDKGDMIESTSARAGRAFETPPARTNTGKPPPATASVGGETEAQKAAAKKLGF